MQDIFFKDDVYSSGQIGIPPTSDVLNVFEDILMNGNIRELMTMCMNVYKSNMCEMMFDIKYAYKKDKTERYNVNYDHVIKRIKEIENIIQVDIEEYNVCPTKSNEIEDNMLPSQCDLKLYLSFLLQSP